MGASVLSVTQLRDEVAELLTAGGVKAYAQAPAAFQAPGAVIDLDDPLMTMEDSSFGSLTLHLNVYLLVNPSPKWEDEVLAMIAKTLNVLRGKVQISSVQMYDTVEITGTTRIFRGAVIKLAADVAIKELV